MFKYETWTIAYRKRVDNSTLLDNQSDLFCAVPNSWRYWRADPFLFEKGGVTYLFAEMYDRLLHRGVIGVCTLSDSGASEWEVCLKLPFHLSYPFVFEKENEIYMIPESYMGNEIAVYHATDFPMKWEKIDTIKDNCQAVDSTLFEYNNKHYLITQALREKGDQVVIYETDQNGHIVKSCCSFAAGDTQVRPAGKLFNFDGKLVRPAQDCSSGYGSALNFYEVSIDADGQCREELIQKIYPPKNVINFNSEPEGIHTYNFTSKYEVIDLKTTPVDLLSFASLIFWTAIIKTKRLFKR